MYLQGNHSSIGALLVPLLPLSFHKLHQKSKETNRSWRQHHHPFSCRMFTKAVNIKWCGWLITNCVLNLATNMSKESIERGVGSHVNQPSAPLQRCGEHVNNTTSFVIFLVDTKNFFSILLETYIPCVSWEGFLSIIPQLLFVRFGMYSS